MKKILVLTLIPLVMLAAIFSNENTIPLAHALTGTVCIAEATATTCPASPPAFNGPVTTPTSTQLRVAVFIANSNPLNGFDITIKADPTKLNPHDADLTGTVLPGSPTILSKCIGGVLKSGTACQSTDTADTITVAAVAGLGQITNPPTTGLLFTAIFNITGTTSVGGIMIDYQTSCPRSPSSTPPLCIAVSDGGITPVPETGQAGGFDNSIPPPFATLSASPTAIGPIFPGHSTATPESTVTANSNSGFETSTTPIVTLTAVASTTGFTTTFAPNPIDLTGLTSGTSDLDLGAATALAPGNYQVTVFGIYTVTNSISGVVSTLSHSVGLSIVVQDFSLTVTTPVSFWSGQTGSSTITITSLNSFTGTVVIAQVSISPSTGLTQTIGPPTSVTVPAGGSATVTVAFSSSTPGSYTVTDRGSGTLSGFTRIRNAPGITVRVQDFTITAQTPVSHSQGSQITLTSLPSGTAGFAGTMSLSVSSINATGLTVAGFTPNPATLTAGGTATSAITFTATATGDYSVTVQASATIGSQTQTKTTIIIVTVTLIRDIAVASITTGSTVGTVGTTVTFTITIQNKGTATETLTVNALANNIAVATQNVTLAAGKSQNVTLTWDTTGYAPASYQLGARVIALSGETSTADNTLTSGSFNLSATPSAGLDSTLIAIIAVIAILVVVGLILFLRRRGTTQAEAAK